MPLPSARVERVRNALETPSGFRVSSGMRHLLVLCASIVAIGMIPGHLTRTSAVYLCVTFAVLLLLALGGAVGVTQRLVSKWDFGASELVLAAVRRVGLPLLGLVFFLFWTVVYVALWAVHPEEAFTGLAEAPRFADFFYYAVSTAFVSPPGDIFAASRGARSATMIEMLTGFALLAAYLASFVDWNREEEPKKRPRKRKR